MQTSWLPADICYLFVYDLGVLAPGNFADIVAMSRDPMADIRATAKVDFLMKDEIVYRDATRRRNTTAAVAEERKNTPCSVSQWYSVDSLKAA
jgi:hypothetical protein